MAVDSQAVYAAIKARRSVRKYKTAMVPRDVVKKVLYAANWAPSGMNEQAWEFWVVAGGPLDMLRRVCEEVIELRMPPAAERNEQQQAFARWYATLGGAPLAVVVCIPEEADQGRRKMVLESAAACFQNLLLAATAEGLGTCWMTGPLAKQDKIKDILGLDGKEIVAVTPLGYPDEYPPPPARKDEELVDKVHWVGFGG